MGSYGWDHLGREEKETILKGIREGDVFGGPFHVEIYPEDKCNLDCFFCSTTPLRMEKQIPGSKLLELIGELQDAGTRSVRLSGGGEPLLHRDFPSFAEALLRTGIRIENITTNGILMTQDLQETILESCDSVMVSLNTSDPDTYSEMMRTPTENFHRAVTNTRQLVERKNQTSRPGLKVQLQYLVYRGNFRLIPDMVRLARDLGVDEILFNGISGLPPEQKMTPDETREMMSLYEEVIRQDEFRKISTIQSFEQDLRPHLAQIQTRIKRDRASESMFRRALKFLARRDFTLREKMAHRKKVRETQAVTEAARGFSRSCFLGWYSMVVRADGGVSPCCILQDKTLGNIHSSTIQEIWHGEPYRRFRRELMDIMSGRYSQDPPGSDSVIIPMCAKPGACPVSTFFYDMDLPFRQALNEVIDTIRRNPL